MLRAADCVLVHRDGHMPPLSPLYDRPYTVLQRAPQFITIHMGDREENVHVQRLKPFADAAEPPAVTPRRGRPPLPPAQPHAAAPPRGASSSSGPPIRRVQFTLPLRDQPPARSQEIADPPAEEPETVFPSDASKEFFVRPGSCSTDTGCPQRLWQPPSRMDL